jgi:hypothetical protein
VFAAFLSKENGALREYCKTGAPGRFTSPRRPSATSARGASPPRDCLIEFSVVSAVPSSPCVIQLVHDQTAHELAGRGIVPAIAAVPSKIFRSGARVSGSHDAGPSAAHSGVVEAVAQTDFFVKHHLKLNVPAVNPHKESSPPQVARRLRPESMTRGARLLHTRKRGDSWGFAP